MNIQGRLFDLEIPKVMGILNLTTDSFYDGGRYLSEKEIMERVVLMMNEGVDIIDVGAQSSRPGADEIPAEDEALKVEVVVKAIRKSFPDVIISVDTYRSLVAKRGIDAGANLINDISGGNLDSEMLTTVASMQVPYIMMHMRGNPKTMQGLSHYENLLREILFYFQEKIRIASELGIKDIIVDPGFGFAKTMENNYELLKKLSYLKVLACPVLVGLSRKSMIYKSLNCNAEDALNGTTVLHTFALLQGANILRVHDVKAAKEAITLTQKLKN